MSAKSLGSSGSDELSLSETTQLDSEPPGNRAVQKVQKYDRLMDSSPAMSDDLPGSALSSGRIAVNSPDSEERGLTLSRPHLSTKKGLNARQAILGAVEALERDKEELLQLNADLVNQIGQLKHENLVLRQELRTSSDKFASETQHLKSEGVKLRQEFENQRLHFLQEVERKIERGDKLDEENSRFRRELDNLRFDLGRKELDARNLTNELETVRSELETVSTQRSQRRDVEGFHEVQLLKNERRDLMQDNHELQKQNKQLANEVSLLQNKLGEKTAELRNENRRHSLLTKEFNSLLEENNHLKLKLRRRRNSNNASSVEVQDYPPKAKTAASSSENVSQRPPSKAINTKPSVPRRATMGGQAREYSVLSERLRLSKERSSMMEVSSNLTSCSEDMGDSDCRRGVLARDAKEPPSPYIQPHSSSTAKGTLPSIISNAASKTWKP